MSLEQALNVYFSQQKVVHQVWGFLAAVALGYITLAWSDALPPRGIMIICLAFTGFAVGNLCVLESIYEGVRATHGAVMSMADSTTREIQAVAGSLAVWQTSMVATIHVVIDLGVLALIAGRLLIGVKS